MIRVEVSQLFLSNMGFVVLLKGEHDERSLPIFIGAAEAQSIALCMNKVKVPRPMTHDLMKNMLDFMECRLHRVEVWDLVEGTFMGRLVLDRDGVEMPIDSRPSDAIALALRCSAPIYADEKVMEEAGRVFTDEDTAAVEDGGVTDTTHDRKELTPLEILQLKLEQAVRDERYEEAASLRDEIKNIESSQSGN